MSSSTESGSPLLRFLDSFLQERNIKWMLGIGMILLLGSSMRLVSLHWENYAAVAKYAILMAYTSIVYVASQVTYLRMGLRRTGTALMALTVTLIPLTFHAVHWIQPSFSTSLVNMGSQAGLLTLLVVNLVMTQYASSRLLRHFLRQPQRTFELAYVTLCLAGAILPALPRSTDPFSALLLWGIFTAGTLKVNRHVFWLTEEERLPRIFGFFPIALLGGLFLGLFAVQFSESIQMPWWGLGCALVAVPVLLTTDTLWNVFQERTGGTITRVPVSIGMPLVVGLLLCVAGLSLATTRFPPYALVPTAAICTGLMVCIARRTGLQAFTWLAILCALIAYQFSPVFFLEFARQVVATGAAAVREQKLPYAFYGLTYSPILLCFVGLSGWLKRKGMPVFSIPLQQASIGITSLLLIAATGHPKALFPVCITSLVLLALQIVVYQKKSLLLIANAALLGAAYGFPVFQATLLPAVSTGLAPEHCLMIAALLQLLPGRTIDRIVQRIQPGATGSLGSVAICQTSSLVTTLMIAVWSIWSMLTPSEWPIGLDVTLPCLGLLVIHSMIWLSFPLGLCTGLYLNATLLAHFYESLFGPGFTFETILRTVCVSQGILWLAGSLLSLKPDLRLSRAFEKPLHLVSGVILLGLICVPVIPVLGIMQLTELSSPHIIWTAAGLAVWCWLAAMEKRTSIPVVPGVLLTNLLVSCVFVQWTDSHYCLNRIPISWVMTSGLMLFGHRLLQHRRRSISTDASDNTAALASSPFRVLDSLLPSLLLVFAIITLPMTDRLCQLAGVLALIILAVDLRSPGHLFNGTLLACIANWQLLRLVFVPQGAILQQSDLMPYALFSAASLLAVEVIRRFIASKNEYVLHLHVGTLLCLVAGALPFSLAETLVHGHGIDAVRTIAVFSMLAAFATLWGCRARIVELIWAGQGLLLVLLAVLFVDGILIVNGVLAMFALLGLAAVYRGVAAIGSRHVGYSLIRQPFERIALVLPLISVAIGIFEHTAVSHSSIVGLSKLAMLLAAGFYFGHGLRVQNRWWWVLSLAILNLTLALFWNDLRWTEPLLFLLPIGMSILLLAELLDRELPVGFHDPLRYIGALTILVSPTFQILQGSWIHLLTLMISSVGIILLAIGVRVRSLVYTGTAFLIVDLIALIVRGSYDNPHLLWIVGIGLGAAVIGLAAYCEHHREALLSRIRLLAGELQSWR
ncbi:hypothetical protein SH661x_002233 [Planctomicrobium sp. SH661]|uniref:hypothetical protein n=1 Tax=Planctomicrobium sp. SH661 TaxID=3448124 RepID=UPI003F5C266E